MTLTAPTRVAASPAHDQSRGALHWVLRVLLAAVSYWVAGKLALLMAIPPGYATAVWPAAGLALVCVLFWGPGVTPGIWLGSFFVNIATALDAGTTTAIVKAIGVAAGIGWGAACQAALGAVLIRRFVGFPSGLEEERDIVKFTILGGPISCLVSPTIGVGTLVGLGVVPWSNATFTWWTWWVGDAIGVLIFAPLTLLVAPGAPVWRRRRSIVGIPLVVGFAAITILFLRASAWEETRLRTDFERRAVPLARTFEARLSEYKEIVGLLSSFFDASPEVSRAQFRELCRRTLKKHSGIQGLGWNPRVEAAERAHFEEAARAEGRPMFEIAELDDKGRLRPAGNRPEYVPILYLEPEGDNRSAVGFDVASDAVRLDALTRARRSGGLRATSRVRLVSDPRDQSGVLLIGAVFDRSTKPRSGLSPVRGYVIGYFRIGRVVESALRGLDHEGVDFSVYDESSTEPDRLIYTTAEGSANVPGNVKQTRRWREPFVFGGRRWTIEVKARSAYIAAQRGWQAWMVLAGGLLFVGILGVVLLMATGQAARVQWALDERSAEATRAIQAEEKFRSTIEASSTGMLMVDRQGQIVLVNAEVERLFGYTRNELIGKQLEMLVPSRSRDTHRTHRDGFFADPKGRRMGASGELSGVRKDGSEVPIEVALNPMRTGQGEFVLSSIVDISARKAAEVERNRLLEELRQLNTQLEARVTGRTAELSKALKEREVLIQEIHHRVKNNLQVISSMINMQLRKLEAGANRDALEECQTRVQAIALIHEKLYQSKDYSRVPFSEYARSLASNVFHATGVSPTGITLELEIQDVALAVDRAIPCGLVLNELITNALKHAFKDGRTGTIRVELSKVDGAQLRMIVKDDGVGLPKDFALITSESLGLQLVCTLAEQLDGQLEVDGRDGGTCFRLTFPEEI